MILKNFLKICFNIYLKFVKNIDIDRKSQVSKEVYRYFFNKKNNNIILKNSQLMGKIEIDKNTKINDSIIFGKVKIGKYCSINGPGIKIGGRINGIEIKEFVSIGANVIIQEDNHNFHHLSTFFVNSEILGRDAIDDVISKGKIIIEEDVWIGSNSIILSGVKIGRGSIIGAGSVVTKNIPSYSIVVGNPAKIIRKRFTDDKIKFIEKLEWWKWNEEKIKENAKYFNKDLNINEKVKI